MSSLSSTLESKEHEPYSVERKKIWRKFWVFMGTIAAAIFSSGMFLAYMFALWVRSR